MKMKKTIGKKLPAPKTGLGAVALVMVFLTTLMTGCDRSHPSALVGTWRNQNAAISAKDSFPNTISLFKDGTGIVAGKVVAWKVEGNRLIYTSPPQGWVAFYEVADSHLRLTYDAWNYSTFKKIEDPWEARRIQERSP